LQCFGAGDVEVCFVDLVDCGISADEPVQQIQRAPELVDWRSAVRPPELVDRRSAVRPARVLLEVCGGEPLGSVGEGEFARVVAGSGDPRGAIGGGIAGGLADHSDLVALSKEIGDE
jgi:hypothetical protein